MNRRDFLGRAAAVTLLMSAKSRGMRSPDAGKLQ
ncbi:MAG: twin-arginine translocation signal domain-containing protein, partial [Acidobacteriaceae bacterium]|nr:twin-arginine translocation signal domain-containing protein [Acidobacteriaceae bacterium]